MIVNIAIIGRTYEGTNERTPNECASKRDRNEERTPARVPRGTIHKEEEGKSVCLSGIMTTTMAVLDPFLTDLFMKEGERERETHSNIYYRTDADGLVGGKIAH